MRMSLQIMMIIFGSFLTAPALAATAGSRSPDPLTIVKNGKSEAIIIAAEKRGKWERAAVNDLVHYIGLMTGASLSVADTPAAIAGAEASNRPLLVIGEAALTRRPDLKQRLDGAVKKNPHLRTDGVTLLREGNKVFVAGNNDEAHYFAAAELLRLWGVRWFMPGTFGECVPDEKDLAIGKLDNTSASPFEVRAYWVSWLGDQTGHDLFQKRNMFTSPKDLPPHGHALANYTKGLGATPFDIPITDPRTAGHIVSKVEPTYAAGKDFSLSISDGIYTSQNENDLALLQLQWDKYFGSWSVTDAMLQLYQNVAGRLRAKFPESPSRVGFLIYSNMTLPPVRDTPIDPMFYGVLAPIDFDPIHPIGDPRAPDKDDLLRILNKWSTILDGRLAIYDYDQSMLVWRDLPNPSHLAFRQDVKLYRDLGVLGVSTESRYALATTFLNLYMRGRLMWDPDADTQALLDDFYPKFYGPAARPMKHYWERIFQAWADTIVMEHEYFIAPVIYTPAVLETLARELAAAGTALAPLAAKPEEARSRNEKLYLERMRFMRSGFEMMQDYVAMVKAAATDVDYAAAIRAGEKGLQARGELTAINKAFTTTRMEKGYMFWPGEVEHYQELLPLIDGEKGRMIAKLPLEWAFHRDPNGVGEQSGYATAPVDLSYWQANGRNYTLRSRKDYPDQWEKIRTDLYVQAQGVRFPDQRNYVGDIWYRTQIEVTADDAAAAPHLMFPGLFNSCALTVNGEKIAEREQNERYWLNDYRFQWDIPLEGVLKEGRNDLALHCHVPNHMGGMFRRPFLYSAIAGKPL